MTDKKEDRPAAPKADPRNPQNRPQAPLKAEADGTKPADPAAAVKDPAVEQQTNRGPVSQRRGDPQAAEARATPAFTPTGEANFSGASPARAHSNQPPVPAPSEQLFPSAVAKPDPSRSREEAEQVAQQHIEVNGLRNLPDPATAAAAAGVEPTSDGEPDESQVPVPPSEQ